MVGVATGQTFLVDANNGPGTHYTDLAMAAAAVPDGAVLLVRPGFYDGDVTIQSKSLALFADPGAVVGTSTGPNVDVTVTGLQGTHRVVVKGLSLQAPHVFGRARFVVSNCAGQVVLESVQPTATNPGTTEFEATTNASCHLRGSGFQRAMFTNCLATMIACTVPDPRGNRHDSTSQNGGHLTLVDSHLAGSQTVGPGINAVTLNGGTLRVLGSSSLTGAGGFSGGRAIGGAGTARLDPTVTVTTFGVAPYSTTVAVTTMAMPSVRSTSVPLGSSVLSSMFGPAGHTGFLLVSVAAPPLALSLFADPVWLDPMTASVQAAGPTSLAVPLQSATPIPSTPALRGVALHWQGIVWGLTGWQASNPAVYVVH